jgi:hypothetical protein
MADPQQNGKLRLGDVYTILSHMESLTDLTHLFNAHLNMHVGFNAYLEVAGDDLIDLSWGPADLLNIDYTAPIFTKESFNTISDDGEAEAVWPSNYRQLSETGGSRRYSIRRSRANGM